MVIAKREKMTYLCTKTKPHNPYINMLGSIVTCVLTCLIIETFDLSSVNSNIDVVIDYG